MDIQIKEFAVDMKLKPKGIELEVRSPDGETQIGSCVVNKTSLTWREGRSRKANGTKITWTELAAILASDDAKKAALNAAKSTDS